MATALAMKPGSSSGNFSHAGQNQYRPIRRRRQGSDGNILEFSYFSNPDRRMTFENSKDPTYIAFEHIDNLPLHTVIREMTKETFKDLKKIDLRTSLSSLMLRR
ncbi:MAG: hypothetical protein PHE78_02880 [Candidatus Gastranaerophilales bacterium]|nr:hypothetical protein [Candidatus Gastranaerophilales bacterium]